VLDATGSRDKHELLGSMRYAYPAVRQWPVHRQDKVHVSVLYVLYSNISNLKRNNQTIQNLRCRRIL